MKNQVLLPKNICPIRYQILVKPDLKKFVFAGEETIFLKILKPTNTITLHAKDLEISDVFIKTTKLQIAISRQISNLKNETATFYLKDTIRPGQAELSLKFKGVLNDQMRGFYRSKYKHKGREKFLAATQFEATDARRAFPCVDEPEAKAIFDISVIVPRGHKVISNTIEEEIKNVPEHGAGFKLVKFAPTPKMSTYLAAILVGDFEFIQAKTKRGVLVRIFTTPGKKHQGQFALSCAIKALEFYEQYFNIPYPLPILDLIALPDFASAAMENWGAVTYRETALLVDKEKSTAETRQWVAIVIAHELAHQWFGNLVTMKWWTHLWLNEGFASYMEYLCVNHMFPEWQIWKQYVSGRFASALRLDALNSTHPIEVEVKHPHEVSEIFDEVSYAKGSAVIRMLAEYLGPATFKQGLRHYLKKHSFKNTVTEQLWESLEFVSKKPVKKIMNEWTKQPGYPLVRVIEKAKKLELIQDRFFSSRISKKGQKKNQIWNIPINTDEKKYLFATKKLLINKPKKSFKLNCGEYSLLRVDYPAQILNSFSSEISAKRLSPVDRLALIRDAFALAESGQLPTTQALHLLKAYRDEDELAVWEEICAGLFKIGNIIYFENFKAEFDAFVVQLILPISKKLGWEEKKSETESQKMLRTLILQTLGFSGHSQTIRKALQIFNSKKEVPAYIRSAVYNICARTGGSRLHRIFINRHKKENHHEEKDRLSAALANFSDQKLLKKSLDFAISNAVRPQDTIYFIAKIWQKPFGRDLAWRFFQKNFKFFASRYDAGLGLVARMISASASFADTQKAREIGIFFKKHPVKAANRTLKQVQEKIISNAAWYLAERKNLQNWFKNPK